jgi:hypothetical protein
MKKQKAKNNDPSPYDGPIERADGVRPYNHYLWPTEIWEARRDINDRISRKWHFCIIALADGRFATQGDVWSIEKNNYGGWKVVFATRNEAIRTAAARMIRRARISRGWTGMWDGGLQGKRLEAVINWALAVVARETAGPAPKCVRVKEEPPPVVKSIFPLFDFAKCT